jgi:hypothetical protein
MFCLPHGHLRLSLNSRLRLVEFDKELRSWRYQPLS